MSYVSGMGFASKAYIYFISPVGGGPIKVGSSKNPASRMSGLMSWSPVDLEILAHAEGVRAVERIIKTECADYLIRGEWYEPCEKLLQIIEETKRTGQLPDWLSKAAQDFVAEFQAVVRERWSRTGKRKMYKTHKGRTPETVAAAKAKRNATEQRKRSAFGNRRKFKFQIVAHQQAAE